MVNNALRIIGTSHISIQSINEIKEAVEKDRPDIIALELDLERAKALMLEKQKRKISLSDILKIGIKGYLFAKIGQFAQQKLGKMVGISPGSEMKTALELARKEKIDIALIDQPIAITLKNFSKNLTWREKGRFFVDLVKGIISPRKQMKELGLYKFNLKKVPGKEMIKKMVGQLKKRFPSIYKTLVEDRNKYMVKKLVKLMREKPDKKILVIIGAGHQEGMEELLLKVDVVR